MNTVINFTNCLLGISIYQVLRGILGIIRNEIIEPEDMLMAGFFLAIFSTVISLIIWCNTHTVIVM